MFRRYNKEHKGFSFLSSLFGLFRVLLSLFIMAVLILGIYQAYKSFSGVDPLTTNPKAILERLMSSEDAFSLITTLLTASPQQSLDKAKQILEKDNSQKKPGQQERVHNPNATIKFKFAIVTDSHTDNQNLNKALTQAKEVGAKFIVGLGDYTDVGTIDELRDTKIQFDSVNLPYYLTVGDHDLWDSRNRNLPPTKNFSDVFGLPYQSFGFDNVRIILLYDSDNYLGVDEVQMRWLEDELSRIETKDTNLIFVMTSTPLFHPSSDHVMGKTNDKLKVQAEQIISVLKQFGVNEVFAGDTHFYSRYTEPKTDFKMTTVGAVTATRNSQAPRFVLIDVYDDGGYNVQDTEIK